jgi:PST family polysaccharide transporter
VSGSKHVFYGRIAKVGVIWTFLGRGFYELVQIPASMVTARLLTPEEFGVVAAANVFVQIAQRLTNFGFNTALMQRGELQDDHKSTVFVASSVVGVAMWLILTVLSPFFSSMFRSRDLAYVLPVVGAVFLINSLASVPIALMARDLRFRENTVLNALHATVTAGVGIWLAWRGWGVWSLIWAQVAAAVVHTVARLVVSGWWPRFRFSRTRLQELLSFGIGLHFQRLLEAAALNVDNLVIGRLLGLSALGF